MEIRRANQCADRVDRLPAWRYCSPQGPDRRGLREAQREVFPVPGGGSARVELSSEDGSQRDRDIQNSPPYDAVQD